MDTIRRKCIRRKPRETNTFIQYLIFSFDFFLSVGLTGFVGSKLSSTYTVSNPEFLPYFLFVAPAVILMPATQGRTVGMLLFGKTVQAGGKEKSFLLNLFRGLLFPVLIVGGSMSACRNFFTHDTWPYDPVFGFRMYDKPRR